MWFGKCLRGPRCATTTASLSRTSRAQLLDLLYLSSFFVIQYPVHFQVPPGFSFLFILSVEHFLLLPQLALKPCSLTPGPHSAAQRPPPRPASPGPELGQPPHWHSAPSFCSPRWLQSLQHKGKVAARRLMGFVCSPSHFKEFLTNLKRIRISSHEKICIFNSPWKRGESGSTEHNRRE